MKPATTVDARQAGRDGEGRRRIAPRYASLPDADRLPAGRAQGRPDIPISNI